MNYYKNQLKRLNKTDFFHGIKIFDGNGMSTNQMDINLESIPVFIEYLKQKQKELSKKENKNENIS